MLLLLLLRLSLQSLRSFLVLSRRRRCGSGACVCVATMTNELLAVVVVVSFRSKKPVKVQTILRAYFSAAERNQKTQHNSDDHDNDDNGHRSKSLVFVCLVASSVQFRMHILVADIGRADAQED